MIRKADNPAIERPSIGIQRINLYLRFRSMTSAREEKTKKYQKDKAIIKADVSAIEHCRLESKENNVLFLIDDFCQWENKKRRCAIRKSDNPDIDHQLESKHIKETFYILLIKYI